MGLDSQEGIFVWVAPAMDLYYTETVLNLLKKLEFSVTPPPP